MFIYLRLFLDWEYAFFGVFFNLRPLVVNFLLFYFYFWRGVFVCGYLGFFVERGGKGGGFGGVFTLSKKLFYLLVFVGELAYVQYRVIELFPIGAVGLVFFTVPYESCRFLPDGGGLPHL